MPSTASYPTQILPSSIYINSRIVMISSLRSGASLMEIHGLSVTERKDAIIFNINLDINLIKLTLF